MFCSSNVNKQGNIAYIFIVNAHANKAVDLFVRVTDLSFSEIYGPLFLLVKQITLSSPQSTS